MSKTQKINVIGSEITIIKVGDEDYISITDILFLIMANSP